MIGWFAIVQVVVATVVGVAAIAAGLAGRRPGDVTVGGTTFSIAGDAAVEVKGKAHPYVSRGGLKLAHAIAHFGIDCGDKVGLDVGASAGGARRW